MFYLFAIYGGWLLQVHVPVFVPWVLADILNYIKMLYIL